MSNTKPLAELKEQLLSKLTRDLGLALDEMTKVVSKTSIYRDDVIIVNGRLRQLHLDELKSIITRDEGNVERNKIRAAIIKLVDLMTDEDVMLSESTTLYNPVAAANKEFEDLLVRYARTKESLEDGGSSFDWTYWEQGTNTENNGAQRVGYHCEFTDFRIKVTGSFLNWRSEQLLLQEWRERGKNGDMTFFTRLKGQQEYLVNVLDIEEFTVVEDREEGKDRSGPIHQLVLSCRDKLRKIEHYAIIKENMEKGERNRSNEWLPLSVNKRMEQVDMSQTAFLSSDLEFLQIFARKLREFQSTCFKIL